MQLLSWQFRLNAGEALVALLRMLFTLCRRYARAQSKGGWRKLSRVAPVPLRLWTLTQLSKAKELPPIATDETRNKFKFQFRKNEH